MKGYVHPPLWFADGYAGADAKFQQAAGRCLAESHRHPLTGPDGAALHTRVARIGPARARRYWASTAAPLGRLLGGFAGG